MLCRRLVEEFWSILQQIEKCLTVGQKRDETCKEESTGHSSSHFFSLDYWFSDVKTIA